MPLPTRSHHTPTLLTLVVLLLPAPPLAARTVNWNGASDSWGNASRWNTQSVPVAGDDVNISPFVGGVTVTLDRNYTVGPLSSVILQGPNTLDLDTHQIATDFLGFDGGALRMGSGTSALILRGVDKTDGSSGGNGHNVDATSGRITFTAGTIDLSGGNAAGGFLIFPSGGNAGNLSLGNGSSIELNPGATVRLRGGSSYVAGNGGALLLQGGASLLFNGGTLDLHHGDSGFVGAQPGALLLSGGSVTGSVADVQNTGGLFTFTSGTLHLTSALTIGDNSAVANALGGDAAFLSSSQNLLVDGPVTVGAGKSLALVGGTLDVSGRDNLGANATPLSLANFTMTTGLLAGIGGQRDAGSTPAGRGATVSLGASSTVTVGANATIDLRGGNNNTIGSAGAGGTLNLNAGAQATLNAGGLIDLRGGNTGGMFGAGGNAGTLNVNTGGQLTLNGGLIDLSPGAGPQGSGAPGTLALQGGTLHVATATFPAVVPAGNFTFTAGTLHLLDTATVTLSNTALPLGNSLNLATGMTLASDANLTLHSTIPVTLSGGTIRAYGKQLFVPPTASFTFNAGAIDLSGKPTVADPANPVNGAAGGVLRLDKPITLDPTRTLTLAGAGGAPAGTLQGNGGNGGTITLSSTAALTLNAGTLNASGGNASSGGSTSGLGGNGGIVAVNGGRLTLVGGTLNLAGGNGSTPGTPGYIQLDSNGTIDVNTAAVSLNGGTVKLVRGTLHVTDPAGFATGTTNAFNRALGGNDATLPGNVTLAVDHAFTVSPNSTFRYDAGSLQAASIAVQPNATFAGHPNFTNVAITNNGTFVGSFTLGAGATLNGGGTFADLILNAGAAATFDTAPATTAGQSLRTLTVNNTGRATVTAGAPRIGDGAAPNPLTIGSTGNNPGTIDVTTRGLIVDYPAANEATVLQTVKTNIARGYHAGAWDGPGITSSTAAANPNAAVGYVLASDLFPGGAGGTFLGRPADATAVLLRYTLAGDANLDGRVDFNDLVKLAQNYNTPAPASAWFNGDFTYDNTIDFNDLVKLAQNYNTALPASPIPGASTAFTEDLGRAFATVPEPSTAAALAASILPFLPRRPKRRPSP